jgi:hypothetical protein
MDDVRAALRYPVELGVAVTVASEGDEPAVLMV